MICCTLFRYSSYLAIASTFHIFCTYILLAFNLNIEFIPLFLSFFASKNRLHIETNSAGKSLQRDDLLISVELQEIIDMIFGNGDGANANSDEEDAATTTTTAANDGSGIVANSKFIQLSSIKQDVESTSADCYYPNNGNSVVFRETTV